MVTKEGGGRGSIQFWVFVITIIFNWEETIKAVSFANCRRIENAEFSEMKAYTKCLEKVQ